MKRLKIQFSAIPKKPGVYFFKDKAGKIIYIGKAAVLRARIRQYFAPLSKNAPPKMKSLQETMRAVKWKLCESEIAALIEEARLIKKHLPRFNVIFRDDKNYAYACATNEKPYPRIFITHQPEKVQNAKFKTQNCIGPFTDAAALRYIVRLLRVAYPYCAARPGSLKRPCFDFHIGRCTGACIHQKMHARTKRNINAILRILLGEKKSVLKQLEKAMKKSAREEEFIKAHEYKRRIERLEKVFAHGPLLERAEYTPRAGASEWPLIQEVLQKLLGATRAIRRVEGYDISHISGKFAVGSMAVCEDGFPVKSQYRIFRIKYSGDAPNDPKMMAETLSRRFTHPEWPAPDVILLDGGKGQLSAALRVVPPDRLVMALAKENEEIYLPRKSNPVRAKTLGKPFLFFVQRLRDEAHRFAVSYHKKLRGKIFRA